MHSLQGLFVKKKDPVALEGDSKPSYPIKIVISQSKARVIYFDNETQREEWLKAIKEASGSSDVEEFYNSLKELGKGHFGKVYLGEHKVTKEKVAIKSVKRKLMSPNELAQQRQEIEVLKMCQHPNIVRMQDCFENDRSLYMILEFLQGGDLYEYMYRRGFDLPEKRARNLAY